MTGRHQNRSSGGFSVLRSLILLESYLDVDVIILRVVESGESLEGAICARDTLTRPL